MKNTIFLVFVLLFISCKKEVQKEKTETTPIIENETTTKESEATQVENNEVVEKVSKTINQQENPIITFEKRVFDEDSDHQGLLGFYVGSFNTVNYQSVSEKNGSYSNKINISIDHIKRDSLFGHSVVAGNARPFKGKFNSKTLFAEVVEPGDDKYDGVFEFTLDPEKTRVKGIWIANDKNLAVPKRDYNLKKKEFKYDSKLNLDFDVDYDYNLALYDSQDEEGGEMEAISAKVIGKLNASTEKLTNQNIENLNKGELEVLRNLIYARHGYSFKNRKMRYFFDTKVNWYIPVSTDVRSQLTDLEKKNIDLIKRYEQHAERYYDYFGR
ncbi:YARHG domain-containing protein [Aquimarina sp. BL5]|uniref:YARHG domain-containing protein n=1 Tax=Aquimarina sp. BL5 TaxID=1714860 RepID=UPI000E47280B|nr:YARHG domain-containing protein [Aquimarina sp. BL5]AXT52039.1 YARHG domain-containing protein [Aquimarina sp. BL5]RKN11151.1 YARHG domain-containing protein [Aquimarina sp. BL5]